jgi:hypothetical protein
MTQKRLKELLVYDQNTGVFTNKVSRGPTAMAGAIAGWLTKRGYRKIYLDGKTYRAHQLVFLYILGYLPKEVDHVNHIKDDNRFNNVREVTHQINMYNRPKENDKTKSKFTGVSFAKRNKSLPWRAKICVNKKSVHLGYYATPEEASEVYQKKKQEVVDNLLRNTQ